MMNFGTPSDTKRSQILSSLRFLDESMTNDNTKIQNLLQAQRTSNNLSLSDQFIGDAGAAIVSEFLTKHIHYASIEIRGNNLTGEGFAIICDGLKSLSDLQTLRAEWNLIGNNPSGLEALHELVRCSKRLKIIDLRNNKLGPSDGSVLASIIRDSESLESLDLRWNELGDEAAQLVLTTLKLKGKKVLVDLIGNKVREDIIDEIHSFLYYQQLPQQQQTPNQSGQKFFGLFQPTVSQYVNKTEGVEVSPPVQLTESQGPRQLGRSFLSPNNPMASSQKLGDGKDMLIVQDSSTQRMKENINSANIQPLQNSSLLKEIDSTARVLVNPGLSNLNQSRYIDEKNTQRLSATGIQSQKNTQVGFSTSQGFLSVNKSLQSPQLQNYDPYQDLKIIQIRYEQEAAEIHTKYQSHIEAHSKMAQRIQELENLLLQEQNLTQHLDQALQSQTAALDKAKKEGEVLQHDCTQLVENLTKTDIECKDLKLKVELLTQDKAYLQTENTRLQEEIKRIEQHYTTKIKEIEYQNGNHTTELTNQIELMRLEFQRMSQSNDNYVKEIVRSWEIKGQNWEAQLKDCGTRIAFLEEELLNRDQVIKKMHQDHIEELKKFESLIRAEEFDKGQRAIRIIEGNLQTVETQRDQLKLENEDLLKEIKQLERTLLEERTTKMSEEKRWQGEYDRLRKEVNENVSTAERAKQDIIARETTIDRLENTIEDLKRELERTRGLHKEDLERIKYEAAEDKKRWDQERRDLYDKLSESDQKLRLAENDARNLKSEHERLRELLSGNIAKVISQTFVEHDAKPSYHSNT